MAHDCGIVFQGQLLEGELIPSQLSPSNYERSVSPAELDEQPQAISAESPLSGPGSEGLGCLKAGEVIKG